LKEALHESFSPQVQDLIDDVLSEEEGPERHMLTFLDPNLSDERFVFIRLENRLYEFHITEGKDDSIFALIEELTH
jgi:hypothetical protein